MLLISAATAFAELRVTAFGIFDSENSENVKFTYNVKTKSGVVTKTASVPAKSVSSQKTLDAVAKKLGAKKFVFLPEDATETSDTFEFITYLKPEAKSSNAQFRTRLFYCAKTLVIRETRKYYKSKIPKAVAPMGAFFDGNGASMILTDKQKHPIGTLNVAYETEFIRPTPGECESAEFIVVSRIPPAWRYMPSLCVHPWCAYLLPSGEIALCKGVGRIVRCVGYRVKTTVTFTYNEIKK